MARAARARASARSCASAPPASRSTRSIEQTPAAGQRGRRGIDRDDLRLERQGARGPRRDRPDRRARPRPSCDDAGFGVSVRTRQTDQPDEEGIVLSQSPRGGVERREGATVTITVGEPAPPVAGADAVRVVVLGGGRSSEHPVSLDVGVARCWTASSAPGTRRVLVVIGRDGVWREARDGSASRSRSLPARGLLGRGRRVPGPARPVRRGRHGAGAARVRRRAVRGRRRARLRGLHGQGRLQGADGPGGHAAGALRGRHRARVGHAPRQRRWTRLAEPRAAGVREAGPARVERRDLEGVGRATSWRRRVEAALAHDPVVLVEAAAIGIEVECSVIGNDEPVASEPGQVIAHGDWYDYEAKYTEGGMELVVPAPITAAQRERVRRIAQEAFLRSVVQRPRARRLLRHRAGPGAPERAEHDPGLHRHERLRTPVRGVGNRATRSCWTGCSATRSSATSANARIRTSRTSRSSSHLARSRALEPPVRSLREAS